MNGFGEFWKLSIIFFQIFPLGFLSATATAAVVTAAAATAERRPSGTCPPLTTARSTIRMNIQVLSPLITPSALLGIIVHHPQMSPSPLPCGQCPPQGPLLVLCMRHSHAPIALARDNSLSRPFLHGTSKFLH